MNLKKFYLICISIMSLAGLNAQTKYAKIVVYRNEISTVKDEEDYKIYTDDNLTTSLKNFHFEEFYMPEGSFRLNVNTIGTISTKVLCRKGSTCYLKIYRDPLPQNKPIIIAVMDSMTAKNDLKLLNSPSFKKKISTTTEYQNAIGGIFEVLTGFNEVGMVNTTFGKQATISFGGFGAIGLNYSHDNNSFGWSVELKDQFNTLSPYLTNAFITFNTGILSTTPYFIIPHPFKFIPLKNQKIKIGAGLNYYFNPMLSIETEKLVDGFKDDWNYKNMLGYHLVLLFETKLGKRLKGHTGIKYSEVRYTFDSSTSHYPTDPDLLNPHGNSISCIGGLAYSF